MILIKNGRVFINNRFELLDIVIKKGKIFRVASNIRITEDYSCVINAKNTIVTPGFIDLHVHLREPGFSYKETIKSGTEAAARGGFTSIAAMPNTSPVPDCTKNLLNIKQLIKKDAVVKVYLYSSITKGENGLELVNFSEMAESLVLAFTDDGKGVQKEIVMKKAMEQAKLVNKTIVAHCEVTSGNNQGSMHEGIMSKKFGIKGIPSHTEYEQLERDIKLTEKIDGKYHACHVSTKESMDLIKCAKANGLKVSCEVTPHHLVLCEEDIDLTNANYKMNPPLRSKLDQQALIEGVKNGIVDIIATDHAPHSKQDKLKGFQNAPFGIVGLETCFPLLYTHLVLKNIITLEKLIQLLTINPASLFQLDSGILKVGGDADLTIIDLDKTVVIDPNQFKSKGKNTPFVGYTCQGVIEKTFVQGKMVYKEKK